MPTDAGLIQFRYKKQCLFLSGLLEQQFLTSTITLSNSNNSKGPKLGPWGIPENAVCRFNSVALLSTIKKLDNIEHIRNEKPCRGQVSQMPFEYPST